MKEDSVASHIPWLNDRSMDGHLPSHPIPSKEGDKLLPLALRHPLHPTGKSSQMLSNVLLAKEVLLGSHHSQLIT